MAHYLLEFLSHEQTVEFWIGGMSLVGSLDLLP